MSSSTDTPTAFDAHQAWLRALHASHARISKSDLRTPAPFGLSSPAADAVASSSAASMGPAAASPLPSAPTMWGRPEEANNMEYAFASIDLEGDDFEGPVYRSLGGLFSSGNSAEAFAGEEDEVPVYRSLDLASTFAAAPAPAAAHEEDSEREWLASMPPLIHRQ